MILCKTHCPLAYQSFFSFLAGPWVRKAIGLPYVLDFRDPWTIESWWPEQPNLKAKVELYRREGSTASSMGKLRFYDGELPTDVPAKKGEGAAMNLPAAMLPTVLDMLRHDSPLYFAFHEGRDQTARNIRPWAEDPCHPFT